MKSGACRCAAPLVSPAQTSRDGMVDIHALSLLRQIATGVEGENPYTDPDQAEEFVARTNCTSLAVFSSLTA